MTTIAHPRPARMTAEQRRARKVARALEHIVRGPCGAWHWVGANRGHASVCLACQRLGGGP